MKKIYVNDIDLDYSYIVVDPEKVQPYQDGKQDEKRDETIELLEETNESELEAKAAPQGFEIIDKQEGYLCFIDGDDVEEYIK